MQLFPHNQQAVEKVLEAFKTKSRVAVRHATGTGKSYIIAAVAEHFDSVCVIAPNWHTINEVKQLVGDSAETYTYMGVARDEEKQSKCGYDLIVLDEFHHTGAEKWGLAVRKLIDNNPDAKVLGTSATHIRYLENNRNMADEMFDGNIVSDISLVSSIEQGILPKPTYITALYDISSYKRKTRNRINKTIADDDWRADKLEHLAGVSKAFEVSYGAGVIIKKHLPQSTKRVIVFCNKIKSTKSAETMLRKWFDNAGFKNVDFYHINSKNDEYSLDMNRFESDTYMPGYLKVAISVNMLNEGVHIPKVDSVIMLRETASRIIVEQQIGRCLTSTKKESPIVFDLVNNYKLIDATLSGFMHDMGTKQESNTGAIKHTEEKEYAPFKILDYAKDMVSILNEIDKKLEDRNTEMFAKLVQFYEEHGRMPMRDNSCSSEDIILYSFLCCLSTKRNELTYEQRNWLNDRGWAIGRSSIDERLDKFEAACKMKESGIPFVKSNEQMHFSTGKLHKVYRCGMMNEEQQKRYESIVEAYGLKKESSRMDELEEFIKTNKRLPTQKDSRYLAQTINNCRRNADRTDRERPELSALLLKYGFDIHAPKKKANPRYTDEDILNFKSEIVRTVIETGVMPKQKSRCMTWYNNNCKKDEVKEWYGKSVKPFINKNEMLYRWEQYHKLTGKLPKDQRINEYRYKIRKGIITDPERIARAAAIGIIKPKDQK